jgi:hypothetical protein
MKAGYLAGPVQLQELAERAATTGTSVLDHLQAIRTVLMGQLATMVEAGDSRAAGYLAGQLVKVLETIARISGELGDLAKSTTFNFTTNNVAIMEHPIVAQLQATLLRALAPHPQARADVVAALRSLNENAPPATASPAIGKVIDHVAA